MEGAHFSTVYRGLPFFGGQPLSRPQDAVAASGGCGPRFPSARARAIGPSELYRGKAGGASPVLLWDSVIPDNSLRPQRRGSNLAIVS